MKKVKGKNIIIDPANANFLIVIKSTDHKKVVEPLRLHFKTEEEAEEFISAIGPLLQAHGFNDHISLDMMARKSNTSAKPTSQRTWIN